MPLDIIFVTLQIPILHHRALSNFRKKNLDSFPGSHSYSRSVGTGRREPWERGWGSEAGSEVAVSSRNYYYLKLPTYPSPKPTLLTLTSHFGQNFGLREE